MQSDYLDITTSGSCTVACLKYCPQEVYTKSFGNPQARLSLDDFKRVLEHVPKNVIIVFSGFTEPFLNPQTIDMMEYANGLSYKLMVYTTLVCADKRVGASRDIVRRMLQIPFVEVSLHLPDNEGNAKIPITEEYKANLVDVLTHQANVCFSRMGGYFPSNNRENLCRGIKPKKHFLYRCVRTLNGKKRNLIMLPNCDVVYCCVDFGLTHIVGNLLKDTYNELVAHAKPPKTLCQYCHYAMPAHRYYAKQIYQAFSHAEERNNHIEAPTIE